MRNLQSNDLVIRAGSTTWTMRKTVPLEYRDVEPRKIIFKSMKTDSLSEAEKRRDAIWNEMVAGWDLRLAGKGDDAKAAFAAVEKVLASKTLRYVPLDILVAAPTADIVARVAQIGLDGNRPDKAVAAAVLGRTAQPPILLSEALETYWPLAKDKVKGKSDDQVRRWENPRKKALRNVIEVVGDKPLNSLTRDDTLSFRDWWEERLETHDLTANSANKDLIHFGSILKTIERRKRLGLPVRDLFDDLMFDESDGIKRPSFTSDFIRDRLLAEGALDGLNDQAAAILRIMANTAARPSEIAALQPQRIILDAAVPHILIRPDGRQVKSPRAKRDIPILGVALDALKAFPDGFDRYAHNSAGLSGTVNKFLRENGLVETREEDGRETTMYSLRHSFMDRMVQGGIDDRIRRDIFGHRLTTEEYGVGAGMEHSAKLMAAITF